MVTIESVKFWSCFLALYKQKHKKMQLNKYIFTIKTSRLSFSFDVLNWFSWVTLSPLEFLILKRTRKTWNNARFCDFFSLLKMVISISIPNLVCDKRYRWTQYIARMGKLSCYTNTAFFVFLVYLLQAMNRHYHQQALNLWIHATDKNFVNISWAKLNYTFYLKTFLAQRGQLRV